MQQSIVHSFLIPIVTLIIAIGWSAAALSQGVARPERAKPPAFEPRDFEGLFFSDVSSTLQGQFSDLRGNTARDPADQPASQAPGAAASQGSAQATQLASDAADPLGWKALISPDALEDLIKGAKLRLDRVVTTPAAFASGGYLEARREFSLLAFLFAIVEHYPDEVRWKKNATTARAHMQRVAASTKVGSRQAYDEAKRRLQDLDDLFSGGSLPAEPRSAVAWENLMDLVPLMQLLDWGRGEFIAPHTASAAEFQKHGGELDRAAQLVAVLGRLSTFENMPYADEPAFVDFARAMVSEAQEISAAVRAGNAELARQAAGRLGQCCTQCHESYR